MRVSKAPYGLPQVVTKEILQAAPMGWQACQLDSNRNPIPPRSKGHGDWSQSRISLTTNNLALSKMKLPKFIYQYDIDIDLSPEDKASKSSRQKKKPPQRKGPQRGPPPGEDTGGKDPPKPKLWKRICKVLIRMIQEQHEKYFATDFMKSIYSAFPLDLNEEYRISLSDVEDEGNSSTVYVCRVTDAGRGPIPAGDLFSSGCLPDLRSYFMNTNNTIPDHLINVERALNIALKTTLNMRLTPVGRFSFYREPGNGEENHDLTGGVVNWTGFSTILAMGWKTFVNVDIANTAFVKGQRVYDALYDVASGSYSRQKPSPENARSYGPNEVRAALKLLKGVLVEYKTTAGGKMAGRITDILNTAAREHKFVGSDGKETNVEAYFKNQYKIQLQHPQGICLQLRGKSVVPAEVNS